MNSLSPIPMKTSSHPELAFAIATLKHLASKGNILSDKVINSEGGYKEHHITEPYGEFEIVFYYNPKDSASWGSHKISFKKDYKDGKFKYSYEQYQMSISEFEIESYQRFMKELFEILKALNDDYRSRNPVDENIDYDLNDFI